MAHQKVHQEALEVPKGVDRIVIGNVPFYDDSRSQPRCSALAYITEAAGAG